MHRLLVMLTLAALSACGEPKPPAAPPAATTGQCTNGALLGSLRVDCAAARACVLSDGAPKCVAAAEAEQKETCGMISCGASCSCSSEHECMCPKLGPP